MLHSCARAQLPRKGCLSNSQNTDRADVNQKNRQEASDSADGVDQLSVHKTTRCCAELDFKSGKTKTNTKADGLEFLLHT